MTIKLFRLPQVVLTEIVKVLLPEEIFLLSVCSQKAFHTLQLHIKKSRPLNIRLEISNNVTSVTYKEDFLNGTLLKIRPVSDQFNICESGDQIGSLLKIHYNSGIWETYWACDNSESQTVLTRILDLFQKELHLVELNCLNVWIIEFLQNRQTLLPYLFYSHSSTRFPDQHFFDMLALKVEHFESNGLLRSSFSCYDHGFGAQQTIRLEESRHLNIEKLMKMDQVEITLANCCLSNLDINLFLKHWIDNGGSPRLRLLKIAFISRQVFRMDETLRSLKKYMVNSDETPKEYVSLRAEDPRHSTNRARYRTTPNQELRRPDGGTVIVSWDNELTLLFFPPKP